MSKNIITIVNEKGGVGKTTATACVASILASRSFRVLMLDLDPQSDLTLSFPTELDPEINIFNCIFQFGKLKGVNVNHNLVLVPGSPLLQPVNFTDKLKLSQEFQYDNPRLILQKLLQTVSNREDLIVLIDCPPNKEIIVQNALAASSKVLIPTFCHNYSYNGIVDIIKMLEKFKEKLNVDLEIIGILVNNFDQRNNIDRGVYEMMKETFGDLVFSTPVRTNTKLKETTHLGLEIIEYANDLNNKPMPHTFSGLEDFNKVTDELLERLGLPLTLKREDHER